MKLSVIIPVYNEGASVDKLLVRVLEAPLPDGWEKEIIVVDDASTDGTYDLLKGYEKKLCVVLRTRNGGKGAAVKDGLRYAQGDYILIQDADLEYNPQEYQALLAPIVAGTHTVVFGSRVLGGNNVSYSRIYFHGGVALTKIFNACFGTKLTDLATCYKVFPSHYTQSLLLLPANDFTFDAVELTHALSRTTEILEVPITYQPRKKGEGKKLSFRHGVRCFLRVMSLYLESF